MRENAEMRFAVEWVAGDDVTVLKLFGTDEKQAAIDYAREITREFDRGLVTVIRANFDAETQQITENCFSLYEGFRCKDIFAEI